MRKPIFSALIATSLLGAVAAPSLVSAQTAPPNPAVQSPRPERPRLLPSQLIDARLAYLKTALKITPAQERQWNAFADVMRRQAPERDADIQQFRAERERRAQNPAQEPTAIERLERRQQFLAKASSRLSELLTAARPLYASFSPDQKRIADELLDRGHHFGHRER